jgi:RNA 3'-terminal phosphate cyclase (ATP)
MRIDGSQGEGGGQVVRTAVGLAARTGQPVHIGRIRAGRKKPGLMRQHVTAVRAAAEVCNATVSGAKIGSRVLDFRPQAVEPGNYRFAVGTAGSATLVLQTVLPALITAPGPSELTLEGGTHNPWAPPFDFLDRVFLPLLARFGPRVMTELDRPGFYPAGGGRFCVRIEPATQLNPIELTQRGEVIQCSARALVARLPAHIAERELDVVRRRLDWPDSWLTCERIDNSAGPGNALCLEVRSTHVTELFTSFGRRGVPAEAVAGDAIDQVQHYLDAGVPVGHYLADQLLIPLAVGGGRFTTVEPSRHAETNRGVIERLLGVTLDIEPLGHGRWEVRATTNDA